MAILGVAVGPRPSPFTPKIAAMFLSPRIPMKTLAILCRSLGTLLESGVDIRRSLKVVTKKMAHPATRVVLRDICDEIDGGCDVSEALRNHGRFFPELFVDMVSMGEESGAMPEVLVHLSRHYENSITRRKEFIQSITWPAFQLGAAIMVIAVLILIFGFVAETTGNDEMSNLTFGLSGTSGAITWLLISCGSIAAIVAGVFFLQRASEAKRIVDPILMRIPVLGTCMRSFAIARFSWSFYLTQQTGMPITDSLEGSLRATGNGAFAAQTPHICASIQAGSTLTESFAESRLFTEDFVEMVSVAEESGTVPEALNRMSPQFEEDAQRSLKVLSRAASVLVWLVVAGFIIFFIFSFFLWYLDQINDLL